MSGEDRQLPDDRDWEVVEPYHCIICGTCVRKRSEWGEVIIHNDVSHARYVTFDEEERPQ